MNAEQQSILTSLNTNMEHVLDAIKERSNTCEARGKRLGVIEVKHGKIEERVDTHDKFIWGTVLTSIGSFIGLIILGFKMLMSNAFKVG